MPDVESNQTGYFGFAWWLESIVGLAIAGAIGYCVAIALSFVIRRVLSRWGADVAQQASARIKRPLRTLVPLVFALIAVPLLPLTERTELIGRRTLWILSVVCATWLLIRVSRAAEDIIKLRYPINVADNRKARRVITLTQIARHIVVVLIVIIGGAGALMTFPEARSLGASVLASAGIAGIVVGMAARPALSNLIAGVQIALSEPLAIDDVVIVEGEYGNVEEIAMTYVVIRTWDLRRLIVPLSKFIEEPFQNWTRVTTDLMGTVLIHTDFLVPVDAVREELTRLLKASPIWDGRVNVVHVTDATNGRIELRLLMSASSAPRLWDLRCEIREKMVDFLRIKHPEALARTRMTVVGGPPGAAATKDAADADATGQSDVRPGTPA